MIGADTGAQVARQVANAVLYEGYLLYPYRASAEKNQMRWQFGVLMPRPHAESASDAETWFSQTECLLEPRDPASVRIMFRCLQLQARTIEKAVSGGFEPVGSLVAGGKSYLSWDEAVEQEIDVAIASRGGAGEEVFPVELEGATSTEPIEDPEGSVVGRIVRRRRPVSGVLRVRREPLETPSEVVKLSIRAENLTDWSEPGALRSEAVTRSFIAAHLLLTADGGSFISLLEPPEWARPLVDGCQNLHTWPVLIGDDARSDTMLSSPIILYDFPQVAPESPGDLFDATEIDEILSLRTAALTEAEKDEARATDQRAAAIIDRTDAMPAEILERLHGTVRYVRDATGENQPPQSDAPWWDPGADGSVSPDTDAIEIEGTRVAKGSRVQLRPGARRADAQDLFLAGRNARVEAVFLDVDGARHLAVTLEDDPAADLQQWHGRFFYFAPDEVVPLEAR